MVLDSTVDPTGAWWADNIEQDYAFQGRIQAFFAWVAKYDNVYHLGSTAAQVSQNWYAARADLAAHPVPGPSGQPMVGPDEWDDTFLIGGYDNGFWPGLAAAFASYLNGHSTSTLVSQYDQEGVQNENEFAVYNAVECADVNWPRNWAVWNSATKAVYKTAPFEAWDNAWFNAACAFWPVKGPAKPLQIKGAGLPGILMLQGTLDAATPYAGAQVAHRLRMTPGQVSSWRAAFDGLDLEQLFPQLERDVYAPSVTEATANSFVRPPGRERGIGAAGTAPIALAGHREMDVAPGTDELRQRPRAAQLDVVGMGADGQDPPR